MDHSIAPQTHVFKVNCPKCQKKVKKLLSRLHGLYSIEVEADAGRVTIKSTVHPSALFAVIGGIMNEQESSSEPLTPPQNKNNVRVERWINKMPVAAAADNGNAHYQDQFNGYDYEVAGLHLHELARAPWVKELEFTQTRNIKMIFHNENEPTKDSSPNKFYACDPSEYHSHIKAQHEPKKVGGPNHCNSVECEELRNSPRLAEFVVNQGGPYYSPPPYYNAMPPYHGYPPPPPMPPKNNHADLCCDNVSKCRMM